MIVIALIWLVILLFKLFFTLRVLAVPQRSNMMDMSDVTVMQPVLSGDPALAEVLQSNLQNLPEAHFLWLIDDDDDEGWRVTQQLQACYSRCDIQLLGFAAAPEGQNPKLFKLEQARAQVKTRCIVVLDDDASLSAASLGQLLSELNENTLVTALPCYRPAQNIPSRLLAQFVNDNSGLTYLPLLPFTPPLTLNGMCYILHQHTLAQVGGFAPIVQHLTDDLALATLMKRNNITLVQSTAVVQVQTSVPDFTCYCRQMHRWFLFATLLMREKSFAVNVTIFLLQGLHPLLLWWMLMLTLSDGGTALSIMLTVLLFRHLALRCVQRRMCRQIAPHPLLSLLSECLQPLHLLHALINRTIYWRSRRYRIYSNDRFISR